MQEKPTPVRKILISSANPLFAKGLEMILRHKQAGTVLDIISVATMVDTLKSLESWKPDVVIVDYDDKTIDRNQFLSYFITRDMPLQVMLVSLKASGAVVVYDRKSLPPDEAENWLSESVAQGNTTDPAAKQGGMKK